MLVPLRDTANGSNQPVSKSLIVSLEPTGASIPSTAAEPNLTHA